jgi:hypothetical protein
VDRAVLEWGQKYPDWDEAGSHLGIDGRRLRPFFAPCELAPKDHGSRIRHEIDTPHDRVMKLRGVVPPELMPDRPWWKGWGG